VIISASELEQQDPGSEGMSGYLDPALLFTQSSFNKRQHSGFQMNLSSAPSSFSTDQRVDTSSESDVSQILSQVKAASVNSTKIGGAQSISSQPQKRGIGELFSRSTSAMASSSSSRSLTHAPNPLLLKSESTLSAKLRDKSSSVHAQSTVSSHRPGSETKKIVGLLASDTFSAAHLDSLPAPTAAPESQHGPSTSQSGIRAFFSQEMSQAAGSQEPSQPRLSKSSKEIFKELVGWCPGPPSLLSPLPLSHC
jgi:hypothetical protein